MQLKRTAILLVQFLPVVHDVECLFKLVDSRCRLFCRKIGDSTASSLQPGCVCEGRVLFVSLRMNASCGVRIRICKEYSQRGGSHVPKYNFLISEYSNDNTKYVSVDK